MACGSSPRVRGKHGLGKPVTLPRRIIPARAGQTMLLHRGSCNSPDHPRACGANREEARVAGRLHGSAPRVRGKLRCSRACAIRARIIPARAGQTPINPAYSSTSSDHPRACGANWFMWIRQYPPSGSSPRVRGKQTVPIHSGHVPRIIPARAGQTGASSTALRHRPDHPRACGANNCIRPAVERNAGSSPRVRGKLGSAGG